MPLDLSMCRFSGPALPEPFVRFELEKELKDLLPKATGELGSELAASWDAYRRHLRELVSQGGPIRVCNTVIEPLAKRLGYTNIEDAPEVTTREGPESGGCMLVNGTDRLRVWATALGEDLDAPSRRGHAYRFSHLRIAQRVLLATNERVGILTNGVELRILISDPARTDSQIEISIESHWKRSRDVPDSYRLVLALCSPPGLKALPELIEKARLKQTGVTKELRKQARQAVELFVQDLLDHPENQAIFADHSNKEKLAEQLWHEGLINIFRLLFIFKMESVDDPARAFSFASTSLWRNTFSPSVALAPVVRSVIDRGTQTGDFLENGLRSLFRMFTEGLSCTEINVKPLGGALFGQDATPLISKLHWGERAVAHLLDRMLWTPKQRGAEARERVHYGAMTVQDLGRVYESLIELEPGISAEPMCRLRRCKLEVVVPMAQGKKYRDQKSEISGQAEGPSVEEEDTEKDKIWKEKKTKGEWIEEIPAGRFYLRVGLGRKASGSYYTPDSFVKFLVKETLGPFCDEKSPKADPHPVHLLEIKVADIAMGSGHFLFEACEFLGDRLYEACRLCDELAMQEEAKAEKAKTDNEKKSHLAKAAEYRQRVQDLPDPNDELMAYLPSRAPEDGLTAYSVGKAQALCKRLVAVHCLYGVDLNPLAVELAKLSLWIETHAEGLPLTFLDHRFVVGDSLSGPFFEHLLKYPSTQTPMDDLFTQELRAKFSAALQVAMREVRELEATVGVSIGEIEAKKASKARMDQLLDPFKLVAAAWTGGVMLGAPGCDDQSYAMLVKAISEGADAKAMLEGNPRLQRMVANGQRAIPFDLAFPEVFFRNGDISQRAGFDVVLGNPPWDKLRAERRELLGSLDIEFFLGKEFDGAGLTDREVSDRLRAFPSARNMEIYCAGLRLLCELFHGTGASGKRVVAAAGNMDLYRLFALRSGIVAHASGQIGMLLGGGAAKNPSDGPLRQFLFQRFSIAVFAHFLNLRQLFAGASSRIGFTVISSNAGHQTVRLGRDLLTFQDLVDGFTETDGREVQQRVDNTDSPYASALAPGTGPNLPSFLSSLSVDLGTDMDRTSAASILQSVAAHCEGRRDGRLPDVRDALFRHGLLVSYQGRSIGAYNHLPVEKAGKWDPAAELAMPINDETTKIVDRCRFYRVAVRATPGHPKTNARSLVACLLPPLCMATNSLLVERSPGRRPNCWAILALGVLNSKLMDFQVRPHVQANMNKALLTLCAVPILNSATRSAIVHLAMLKLNHPDFDTIRHEQGVHSCPLSTMPAEAVIDVLIATAMELERHTLTQVLVHFERQEAATPQKDICLALFDELKSIGLEAFTKKYDPYWDIPLNENLPKPVIELPMPQGAGDGNQTSGKKRRSRKAQPGVVQKGSADYGPLFGNTENKKETDQ